MVNHRQSSVRLDIQGLRAVAVITVILNHVFGYPTGAFVGVDVFFVISGFIITSMLLKEYDRTRTIDFKDFYIRRVKRILPAAMLVLLVTVFASATLLPLERAQSTLLDGIWATLFAANWRMLATNVDYFAQDLTPSPLQHYWSLSIEEQFYFLWPWIMLGVLVFFRRRVGIKGLGKKRLLWVIGGISALSLTWSIVETTTSPASAYFSSLTRFWELGVGALAAIAMTLMSATIPTAAAVTLSYLGIGSILLSCFLFTEGTPFPGYAALLPVTGALLVMIAGHGASSEYTRALAPLTNRVAVYLGNISYSLYLWHMPLVVLTLAFLPEGEMYYGVVLTGTLVLSALTYHFIEDPIRKSAWPRISDPNWTQKIAMGVGAAAVTALVLGTGYIIQERRFEAERAVAQANAARYAASLSTEQTEASAAETAALRCYGAGSLDPANQPCDVSSLPLQPAVSWMQKDTGSDEDHRCWRDENEEPVSCAFGSNASDALRVALIGDSHAFMFLPAMRMLAEEHGWSLTTFVGWGCQWAPGGNCAAQTELANRDFADHPFDVIVNLASRRVTSLWSESKLDSVREIVETAASSGTKILHIEDVPLPSDESILCIQRTGFDPLANNCGTPLEDGTASCLAGGSGSAGVVIR